MRPRVIYQPRPPAAVQGRGLGDVIDAEAWPGSTFRFDAQLSPKHSGFGYVPGLAEILENSGYFYDVHDEQLSGWLNPYVDLTGVVAQWFASGHEVMRAITQLLSQYYEVSQIQFYFTPVVGTQIPPAPLVGTSGSVSGKPDDQNRDQNKKPGERSSLDKFLDELATSLGVTRTTAAVGGALGIILLLIVLNKATR